MGPFEFTITLLSFVYSLALTHLLYGLARIIRHRRTITLSASHLIWVATTFVILILNWMSLWDFRTAKVLTLTAIASTTLFAVLLYLIATFVTADVEDPADRDLRLFHERECATYIGAMLLGQGFALFQNLGAVSLGISNWASQNALLLSSTPLLILALVRKQGWLHLICAIGSLAFAAAFLIIYYPVLR